MIETESYFLIPNALRVRAPKLVSELVVRFEGLKVGKISLAERKNSYTRVKVWLL